MEILSVSLTNFKVHRDRHFAFQPGTNAICGENGAGKSTIVEAIAWVLFDYSDYTKTELVRQGTANAQVIVNFISSHDGRTYRVQRCTSAGYAIYDPDLNVNLGLKRRKEEILPWLRTHLGVPRETELADLFANTVGIPQGTFTADFLKPGRDRKKVFDPILNVEDYKLAFEKSNDLRRYAEGRVQQGERDITQLTERLQDWETLKHQTQELERAIAQDEAIRQQAFTDLAQLQQERTQLQTQVQRLQFLDQTLQTLTVQITQKKQRQEELQEEVHRAHESFTLCTTNRDAFQTYQQAETTLKDLHQRTKDRQTLTQKRDACWKRLAHHNTQLATLTTQIQSLDQTQGEIECLRAQLPQQDHLDHQGKAITQQLQHLQTCHRDYQNLCQQGDRLEKEHTQIQQEIEQLQKLTAHLQRIPDLEQQRDRLQIQISRIEAAQQFEADLRHLVTHGKHHSQAYQAQTQDILTRLQALRWDSPLLTSTLDVAIHTLETGIHLQTELLTALEQMVLDLSSQTDEATLHHHLQTILHQIQTLRRYELDAAQTPALQARQQQLVTEQEAIAHKLQQLQTELATQVPLQQQLEENTAALKALGDPRGRIQFLQQTLDQRPHLEQQHQTLTQQQAALQKDLDTLENQLGDLADLENQIAHHQDIKQSHQEAHQIYLRHRDNANQYRKLETKHQTLLQEIQTLTEQQTTHQNERDRLQQTFDPQHLQTLEAQYTQTQSTLHRLDGSLPGQRQTLHRLHQDLHQRNQWAEERDRLQTQLQQDQQVLQFIGNARDIYRQAGPRITHYYLQEITREADRLFRELLNRHNTVLTWTEDYEIRVQEGGHWRSFKSLSGGEQMCAALAVRLALLRIVSDLDIAFFDEPTTNMDQARRRQLAEAIANLRTFRQLFVISHDDTFENITESVIRVEREV